MKPLLIIIAACLIAHTSVAQNTDAEKARLFTRDSAMLYEELVKMSKEDQRLRKHNKDYINHGKERLVIDSTNVVRMIAIINTYGFPAVQRFGENRKDGITPSIILVHTPQQYTDTVKKLIDAEKAAGRISQNEYAHIDWHLNGRKGVPAFEGVKIKTKKNGNKVMKY